MIPFLSGFFLEVLVEDARLGHRVDVGFLDEVDLAPDEQALLAIHDRPVHAAPLIFGSRYR